MDYIPNHRPVSLEAQGQIDVWQAVRTIVREKFRTNQINVAAAAAYIVCKHYQLEPAWEENKDFLVKLLGPGGESHASALSHHISGRNPDFWNWSDTKKALYLACRKVHLHLSRMSIISDH